jgi:NADH-quinone oxidoreductase subunit I
MANVFETTIQGTRAILKGMGVVLQHMFRQPFTVQYPEVRRPIPPRARNRLAFLYDDESEKMRCIGCTSCVVVCPREIIHLKVETVDKKKTVVQFDVDLGDCIGCGNCVEICPVDALELLPDFELAAERKEDLLYDMHKLGKFVTKGYLPAQFYPAKAELPKPVRATPAPVPKPEPAAGTAQSLTPQPPLRHGEGETGVGETGVGETGTAVADLPPPPDPATLSPEELKAAARARTEALKAARAAAKASDNGTMPSAGKTPEEIKAEALAKAARLKAEREAAQTAADPSPSAAAEAPSAPGRELTPDEIKEAGRRKAAELKAAREAAKGLPEDK